MLENLKRQLSTYSAILGETTRDFDLPLDISITRVDLSLEVDQAFIEVAATEYYCSVEH
jgi:hypothetical protein